MAAAVRAVASQLVKAPISTTETTASTNPNVSAARGVTLCAGSGRRFVRRIS
jgi:hypothetical protein